MHFDLATLRSVMRAFCLCVALAVLSGCASSSSMMVAPTAAEKGNPKYRNSIAIRSVTGGKVMNVLTTPQVDNDAFKASLEGSLSAAGYLATGAAKYNLDVELQDLDQPLIGLQFDVKSTATYKLAGPDGVRTFPITASGTATTSDSIVGVDRIRIANERAMQQSIRSFLQQLSR